MSCVEYLETRYYPYVYSVSGGSVLEKNRVGIIKLNIANLLPIEYYSVPPKRLKLKIDVRLTYTGLNPLQEYTCWCGGGISKIAVFVKNPFKQVADLMNMVIQMQMLMYSIQILTSLFTVLV
jgi:hypothetical protein